MPRIQAIVMADHIYRDGRTGKHVVAGTLHQINVAEIPTTLPRSVGVFVVLTALDGDLSLGFQFVSAEHQVLLDMEPLDVSCEDPSEHLEISLEVPRFRCRI